ncbi:MAG: LL-diaminopimelate aminotransferase [Chlamydiae bacterium]|nr:LL-diaminopimelate aminotransferase [Chlamydiota bacterium]
MFTSNPAFTLLKENYVFKTVTQKKAQFLQQHPESELLDLGIGDITEPLLAEITQAIQTAAKEMQQIPIGYAPYSGYDFLKKALNFPFDLDEIFISDGAKSETAQIQELFTQNTIVALMDPVYPVYLESNLLSNHRVVWMPCTKENGFIPSTPEEKVDVIYLCHPSNPTGMAFSKEDLQAFVDYALENNALLIVDVAYQSFVQENIPKSIYEIEGARKCAIEIGSFSKSYGFTGLRLGYTIVPKTLLWPLNAMWQKLKTIKNNGTAYIIQRAGEAALKMPSLAKAIMQRTHAFRNALMEMGWEVYGGVHSPYLWIDTKTDDWEFFDFLLKERQIISTPGSGFGKNGKEFVRFSCFANKKTLLGATQRLKNALSCHR